MDTSPRIVDTFYSGVTGGKSRDRIKGISIGVMALSTISAAGFAALAVGLAGASNGLSFIALVPAISLAAVAFDSYKVMRCCKISFNFDRPGYSNPKSRTSLISSEIKQTIVFRRMLYVDSSFFLKLVYPSPY